jgi:hypothetical protein
VRCRELDIFKILGIFRNIFGIFGGIFLEDFFGGMFLEEFFGRTFLRGLNFLGKLFGRHFLWRNSLFTLLKLFEYERD